jgi:DNA-binding response OmpR family regulator
MKSKFLLVGYESEEPWFQLLSEAIASWGTLDVVSETKAIVCTEQKHYRLVIVDATAVNEVPPLITRIRAQCPGTKFVVITASPSWQQARMMFQAGSLDYIHKSMTFHELYTIFAAIFSCLDIQSPEESNVYKTP